jgi:hypothetical protein
VLRAVLVVAALGGAPAVCSGAWTPPERPDPSAILNEAQADARAKRHADALAKHLWFHHNALKYQPSLYGVRLSFALGSWLDLGKQYPPALQALKEVRDRTGARLRDGKSSRGDFHDFSSINEVLGEEHTTAELFVWLDQNNAALARRSYGVAQKALIHAKLYELCGKYIDSKESLERILRLYREHQRMAKDARFGADFMAFAERSLSHSAATLVALLALNNRGEEADQVAAAVLKERQDAGLRSQLTAAKKGVVPEPWPKP